MLLPKKVKVTCKDGKVYCGYFHSDADYDKLKEEGKFRFIPDSKGSSLKSNASSKKSNDINSIIIKADNVADIDFISENFNLNV